ncbi:hypothetical protein Acr_00g0032180 [Actinidia rufa]|uniref:Uncharacterized protein n=1 Tax=Actinidia rufa TaxID=165716 RepID=A0A7J0DFS1_9ERIC|nr:hypothetical protein Acr_00g0032180 [Actinidia rufa]
MKIGGRASSIGISTASAALEIWVSKLAMSKLKKQVTTANITREHDICFALAQAIMIPRDMANLTMKEPMEVGSLMGRDHYVRKVIDLSPDTFREDISISCLSKSVKYPLATIRTSKAHALSRSAISCAGGNLEPIFEQLGD